MFWKNLENMVSYFSGKEKNIFLWEMDEFSRIAIPIHLPAKKNMLFTVNVLVLLLLPVFYSFIKKVFTKSHCKGNWSYLFIF